MREIQLKITALDGTTKTIDTIAASMARLEKAAKKVGFGGLDFDAELKKGLGLGKNSFDSLQSQMRREIAKMQSAVNAQMRGVGVSVNQGLNLGLKAGSSGINQTIKNISSQLIGTAKKELGVHSPSTVFFGIGQNVIQGFINGIQSGRLDVAFGNLLSSAVEIGLNVVSAGISTAKQEFVKAVQAGANFEPTINAMTVFTGSIRRANDELSDLDSVARTANGLRLKDVEEGGVRLRSLNFDLQTTKDLIQGIGTQKLLSGGVADGDAVNRVITNIQQLRAGSPQVMRDIRQMVLALPSLNLVITDTFGSIEKFQKRIQDNPNEGIKKFAEGMKNAKTPVGGLNDAIGKLSDAYEISQRGFSKPILSPLTDSVKNLTDYLYSNMSVWQKWGQYVGDIIEGINAPSPNAPTPENNKSFIQKLKENGIDISNVGKNLQGALLPKSLYSDFEDSDRDFLGFYDRTIRAERVGREIREKREREELQKKFNSFNINTPDDLASSVYGVSNFQRNKLLRMNNTIDLDVLRQAGKSPEELQADQLNAQRAAYEQQERDRQNNLAKIDSYFSQAQNIRENAFSLEVAQYQNNAEKVNQITQRNYQNEIKETAQFYNNKIRLNSDDSLEVFKLEIEKNNKLRDLQNKSAIEQIKFDREQNQKRRQTFLEFKQLQEREVSGVFDKTFFDAERVTAQTGQGFDSLIELTKNKLNIISSITKDQFAERLKDESLNAQQVANLTKERDLTLTDLAEQTRRKILDIEQQQYRNSIQQIEDYTQKQQAIIQSNIESFQTISQIATPNFAQTGVIKQIFEAVNQQRSNRSAELNGQIEQQNDLISQQIKLVDDLAKKGDTDNKYQQAGKLFNMNERLTELKDNLSGLDKGFYAASAGLGTLFEKINKTGDFTIFDQIIEQSYLAERALQRDNISVELDGLRKQLTNAKSAFDAGTGTGRDVKDLETRTDVAAQKLKNFDLQTQIGNASLETRANLLKEIQDIQSGDKTAIASLQFKAELSVLIEQKSLYQDIFNLKAQIANTDNLGGLLAQRKEFEYIAAHTKSAAESFSDFKLTIADSIFQQASQPFDFLSKKLEKLPPLIRGVGQAFLDMANDIVKAMTQKFVTQLLGLGGGQSNSQSGGGDFLSAIRSIFSGSGNGGTPPFNPNRGAETFTGNGVFNLSTIFGGSSATSSSGGTNWIDTINQIAGGGYGGGSSSSGHMDIFGKKPGGEKFGLKDGMALGALGAMLLGGIVGGRFGNSISMAGTGMGLGMAIGSIIPGLGTVVGGLIGGGIGAIAGLFGFSDPKRKEDKKVNLPNLQKGFVDSINQYRDLIKELDAAHITASEAEKQAIQIRASIQSGFNIDFKSKKYRKVAQNEITRQLAEIDRVPGGLAEQLRAAISRRREGEEFKNRFVATFALGGFTNDAFMSQYGAFKREYGLLRGGIPGKDSIPVLAMQDEMFLTKQHQRGIIRGVGYDPFAAHTSVPNYPKRQPIKMETGGFIGTSPSSANSSSNSSGGGSVIFEGNIILEGVVALPDSKAYLETPDGKRQVINIIGNHIDENSVTSDGIPRRLEKAKKRG